MEEKWMTPTTSIESTSVTPADIHLWFEPSHTLRSVIKGAWCPLKTQLFVSSPLSYPEKFLTLLDGKSEEIAFINHISELSAESRAVAEEAVRQRYLTSKVSRITGCATTLVLRIGMSIQTAAIGILWSNRFPRAVFG